jgi:CarD family transcriptional regulator
VLQILSSGITLMIPTQAPERTGIRQLISDKQVKDVYSILKSPSKVMRVPWNRRFREFNDKLRTGSIREVAEVLRDLKTLQGGKNLSFGERQMFDKAKLLIVSEISEVSAKNSVEIENEVDQILIPN